MKTMTMNAAGAFSDDRADDRAGALKPVVIVVVAAKIAVAGLLMATVNLNSPIQTPLEIAEFR